MQMNTPKLDYRNASTGGGGGKRFLIGGAALVAILTGFYFYTHSGNPAGGGGGRGRGGAGLSAPVKVAPVERRNMAVIERTIGTVVANATVTITARVQGQLISTNFKEGQMVRKGDLLFRIDPAPFQAAYDSANAALLSTKTKAERSANLFRQAAISAQDNDNAQAAYLQAKANLESARLNLEFTQIRSPIDGKTGPIMLQAGNLVSVNGLNAPLVSITQIQPIKISFALPQMDLPRIQARQHAKEGLIARVLLHDRGGEDLTLPVDFVSNAVSATSGTIELRATSPNADASLVPGQLVDVVVELAEIPNAIVVPREAINTGADGQYVYTVVDDTAVQVPIRPIFDDGTNVAVQANLKAGDQVIVDGQLRVVPGGKVTVSRGRPAGAAAAAGGRRNGARGGRRGGGRRNGGGGG